MKFISLNKKLLAIMLAVSFLYTAFWAASNILREKSRDIKIRAERLQQLENVLIPGIQILACCHSLPLWVCGPPFTDKNAQKPSFGTVFSTGWLVSAFCVSGYCPVDQFKTQRHGPGRCCARRIYHHRLGCDVEARRSFSLRLDSAARRKTLS